MHVTFARRACALIGAVLTAAFTLTGGATGAAASPGTAASLSTAAKTAPGTRGGDALVGPGHPIAWLDKQLGITPAALRSASATPASAAAALPTRKNQIRVLANVLRAMKKSPFHYGGGEDVFGYGIPGLWKKGIDGAGTTVAVIEGWNFPGIYAQVNAYDKIYGLPKPWIKFVYPTGKLPATCPPGMVALGSYGSCSAWAGEMMVDVLSVHILAPYAKILISATPADTQETDDAASQVAPPEMMKAVEYIARRHLANVISISDGTGESSYSDGTPEILAQDPGELTAAAAGIPLLVATGDCGVVQNLPAASAQCGDTTTTPDTATWDDSPWVTAVGGNIPVVGKRLRLVKAPQLWSVRGCCSSAAGYSAVFRRPAYQNGVAGITASPRRSVPDITMDGTFGTSMAAPEFGGILALATQVNHGDLGPVNRELYGVLGPRGTRAGIQDVIGGNDSARLPGGKVVPGFTAVKGFDVASGWGTVNATVFVPSLARAATAADGGAAYRAQAGAQLRQLESALTLSPDRIRYRGVSYLLGSGFLPGHPVRLSIGGKFVAKLTAGVLGTVTYLIHPPALHLAGGWHDVRLTSLLLTETARFRS
jgi:hypothetical protein